MDARICVFYPVCVDPELGLFGLTRRSIFNARHPHTHHDDDAPKNHKYRSFEGAVSSVSRLNLPNRMAMIIWHRGKAKINRLLGNAPPEVLVK
ncbi:hypothetical protein BDM02DRAFT_3192076 [Thelephora ganbajun]|uniref:Uncharacterized protein n=1 Tax=Thelephora ganbajun TaxID=370292 RepID=A0ACB6Z1B7_THEGA|nr:hypothetical protein BDM02DRAFT_3192076 [Thelephora ganbajun]